MSTLHRLIRLGRPTYRLRISLVPSNSSSPLRPNPSGSSDLSPSGNSNLSPIAWLVDPRAARDAANATTRCEQAAAALSQTSCQSLKEIDAMAKRSNDIDVSGLWRKPQGGNRVDSAYDCGGGGCHVLRGIGAPEFGLHDDNGLNLRRTSIELRPVLSRDGVSIVQILASAPESAMRHGCQMNQETRIETIRKNFRARDCEATGAIVGMRYGSGHEGRAVHGNAEVSMPDFAVATVNASSQ